MIIKQKFCEDCNHFNPTSMTDGYCEIYNCQEPWARPASNCSDFDCMYKSEQCDRCINKNICK